MSVKAAQSMLHRWRNKGWTLLATALVSFAAGSLFQRDWRALNRWERIAVTSLSS